jgi:hypothetical protein
MKFGELKSIGHNIADSLASGISLLVGEYDIYVFEEAAAAPEGQITVDLLSGTTSGSAVSPDLARIAQRFPAALAELCQRHGCAVTQFQALSARYGTDPVHGRHYSVTVTAKDGRSSTDQYIGVPGQRPKHLAR